MTEKRTFRYPGTRQALDGNTAVIMCERESSDAAGAYPITPSTQMGEYWAEETAKGHINISGRPLIFIEPEGEHAAAAVTAGLSMTGLRATNFSSGQGIAYMHESLYAAVGKRLTYVLNMGCRAMTKSTLNVHAGHDDYHCVDDSGFFQLFGKSAQEVCDLNIISHRIAELSLTPGICAQDGFLTTHLIESLMLPERELIAEYLGRPDDIIETPTAAQKIIYGDRRRRIPELWTVDNPVMIGIVQNQDAYMQSVAAQRPYFFEHIPAITDQAMDEFYQLTGRRYNRVSTYRCEDAEYLILGQGSMGMECLQVARLCGAGLLITVDVRDEACAMSKQLGADHALNAKTCNVVETVRELTGGIGADVVFECAGGSPKQGLAGSATIGTALDAVRSGGKIVGVSWFGAPVEFPIDLFRERSLRYVFPDISTRAHLEYTVRLVASGRVNVKPTITHVLHGLDKVPQAFEITANKGKHRAINPAQVVMR